MKPGVGYKLRPGALAMYPGGELARPRVLTVPIDLDAHPWGPDGRGPIDDQLFRQRYSGGAPLDLRREGRWMLFGAERTPDVPKLLRQAWADRWSGLENSGDGYDGEPTLEEIVDFQVTQEICGDVSRTFLIAYLEGGIKNPIVVTEQNHHFYETTLRSLGIDTLGISTHPGLYGCKNAQMVIDVRWLPGVEEPPPDPGPVPVPDPTPGRATPRRRAEEWHETIGALIQQAKMPKWAPRLWWLGREPFLAGAEALIAAKRRALEGGR